eukprot:jgi/Galph1/2860/GphlegSOOS_G1505.1
MKSTLVSNRTLSKVFQCFSTRTQVAKANKRDPGKNDPSKEKQRQENVRKLERMLRGRKVELLGGETMLVKDVASQLKLSAKALAVVLRKFTGEPTVADSVVSRDAVEMVLSDMGAKVSFVKQETTRKGTGELKTPNFLKTYDPKTWSSFPLRPPVVTVMGHVDHGKTTLLDALRNTHVAASEKGGITQSIGSFSVALSNGAKVTFLDTPGHEAFAAMRACGTSVTDIVVLVVAADDGVMPQTLEAVNHARNANVPIIVAINKIDARGSNPERVMNDLVSFAGIQVEQLGGETQCILISAVKRQGLENLVDAILLQAELSDLRANANDLGEAVCIESKVSKGMGNVANCIVRWGSFHVNDYIASGSTWGHVRRMLDDNSKSVRIVGPSSPFSLIGLKELVNPGSFVFVMQNEEEAKDFAEKYQEDMYFRKLQNAALQISVQRASEKLKVQSSENVTTESSSSTLQQKLNFIVKADVRGSVDAVLECIKKISNEETQMNVVHAGVGAVSESDVFLAASSEASILAFNCKVPANVLQHAKQSRVQVRQYGIIYELLDDMEALRGRKFGSSEAQQHIGTAKLKQIFQLERKQGKSVKIAGCIVSDGVVKLHSLVKVIRSGQNVTSVSSGNECGISITGFEDFQEGDSIEVLETVIVSPQEDKYLVT